jgi:septal ring-binding cell division protein DamX
MLACEIPSLSNAFQHDRPAGTMWLLPREHRGRPCFRVLWGRYPTLAAATAAQESVPGHFRQGANRPAVIDAQKTLLP